MKIELIDPETLKSAAYNPRQISRDELNKLIKSIKPDVLVKGGDYKIKDIVGYKEVTKSGGSVVTIPLLEGLSTSKIISKTL